MLMVAGILFFTFVLFVAGVISLVTFAYLWTGVFVLGFLHMFIGLYAARADKFLYRALLYLPRYTVWKVLLYLKLLRQEETKEWIRTTREPTVAHDKSPDI